MNINDKAMMRKQIVSKIIQEIQNQIEQKFAAYQNNKDISINAPGKMESRYDTRKYEYGVVADNIAMSIMNLQETQKEVLRLQFVADAETIQTGHLVETIVDEEVGEDVKQARVTYLVLPSYFDGNLEEVRIVSVSSPIGQALLGRKTGEKFYVDLPPRNRQKVSLFIRINRFF